MHKLNEEKNKMDHAWNMRVLEKLRLTSHKKLTIRSTDQLADTLRYFKIFTVCPVRWKGPILKFKVDA